MSPAIHIHFVNEFREKLKVLVESARFGKTLREIAQYSGVDHGMLSRVLTGKRAPTSQFVGRLCGVLPAEDAAQLLKAYLDDIVAEMRNAEPLHIPRKAKGQRAPWRSPLSDITINLECAPRRKAAS